MANALLRPSAWWMLVNGLYGNYIVYGRSMPFTHNVILDGYILCGNSLDSAKKKVSVDEQRHDI